MIEIAKLKTLKINDVVYEIVDQTARDGVAGIPTAIESALTAAKASGDFAGAPGKDGRDGKDGIDGKDGYTPQKNIDYFDGKDGKDGSNGKDGYTPQKYIDYFDGEDGKDGKDGKDGSNGKTAYQYAVDGGYTGTEAEFAEKLAEEIPKALTVMVEFDGSSAEPGSVIPAGYNVPYYQILAAYERGAVVICCFYDSSTYDEIASPIIAYTNDEKWFYACGTGSKYRYFIQFTPDGAFATCDALSSGGGAIKHKRYSFEFTASELTLDGNHFQVTEARGVELDSMIAEISSLNVASIGLTGSLPGAGKIIHVPGFCNPRNAALGKSGSIGGRATSDDENVFITSMGFSTNHTTLLGAVQVYGLILTVDVLYS